MLHSWRPAVAGVGELLDRLDGQTHRAMRLVLPHLQTTEPETLLAALDGVGDLPGADGEGRTTSLAACVAYSFGHLSTSTARLAVVLCLCHGIADADALALFSQQPGAPERVDLAEDWYCKALAISEDLHNRPAMATTYDQLGNLAHDRERLDQAEAWYLQSVATTTGAPPMP